MNECIIMYQPLSLPISENCPSIPTCIGNLCSVNPCVGNFPLFIFCGNMGSDSDRKHAWWIFINSVIGWEACQWVWFMVTRPGNEPLINTTYNGLNGRWGLEVGTFLAPSCLARNSHGTTWRQGVYNNSSQKSNWIHLLIFFNWKKDRDQTSIKDFPWIWTQTLVFKGLWFE